MPEADREPEGARQREKWEAPRARLLGFVHGAMKNKAGNAKDGTMVNMRAS